MGGAGAAVIGLAIPPGLVAGAASGLLATTFTNTVSAGVIALSALTALATVIGIVYGVRWKIAYSVEVKAREGEAALNLSLEERIRTLAHERDELGVKVHDALQVINESNKTIARLEALPNLERVLELTTASFERFMQRLEELHREDRKLADERTDSAVNQIVSHIERQAA